MGTGPAGIAAAVLRRVWFCGDGWDGRALNSRDSKSAEEEARAKAEAERLEKEREERKRLAMEEAKEKVVRLKAEEIFIKSKE